MTFIKGQSWPTDGKADRNEHFFIMPLSIVLNSMDKNRRCKPPANAKEGWFST